MFVQGALAFKKKGNIHENFYKGRYALMVLIDLAEQGQGNQCHYVLLQNDKAYLRNI